MKIIRLDRGKGKTTRLIKESARTNAPIITNHLSRVIQIKTQAEDMGLNIPCPIYLNRNARESLRGYDLKNGVLIDDFELLLECLLGVNVNTVTTSCEIITDKNEIGKIKELNEYINNIILTRNNVYAVSKIFMNEYTFCKIYDYFKESLSVDIKEKLYKFKNIIVEFDDKLDDYEVSFSFKRHE